MTEIAQHWRLKAQRYQLVGEVCPDCTGKIFPPRDVCPYCSEGMGMPREGESLSMLEKYGKASRVELSLPVVEIAQDLVRR